MPSALTQSAPPTQGLLQRWNTLQLLKTSRIVLLALTALLLGAVLIGAGIHRNAMQIVGKDTAPSIIAAQHIKSALADMDADLANELIVAADRKSASTKPYDDRRKEAATFLIEAARNITYGASEQTPIETLQVASGDYERIAQQSRDFQDDKSKDAYRRAASLMDRTILPAADALDKANNDVLEREYEAKSGSSTAARLFVGIAGLLALLALAAAQLFLSNRTHRTLNPALLAASVLTLWLTFSAFTGMGSEAHDLKVAREDAFTSVHALWRARATAYSANAAESRYLLDPTNAPEYEREFIDRSSKLVRGPQSAAEGRVISSTVGLTGYLAEELNNVTFPGEKEAAFRTLKAWNAYMAIDAQIRKLEKDGKHQLAVELCIGIDKNQSDWAFTQFDNALGDTLKINQDALDTSVADGFSALHNMEWKAGIAAALIAILIAVGLAPRIREYE